MPGESNTNSKEGIKIQKERFQKFKDAVTDQSKDTDQILIKGEINKDQWTKHEPLKHPEIRALHPVLDRMILNNGLKHIKMNP